ncbi:TOMM precursor leader peptide-binding protein [Thermogemmatispora carboxidivorans]|uniref:TOMM precursor leader peptide-binding protein n=1 Tax=Thermogemmatispora carboxidivorans TaxID=1382306 RepID=UPI00069C503A|nr:TOMM precursor leader peptide-binding protein [Thermogemmatispora carboxidivorans]
MRPRMRGDVFYFPTPEGVYLRNNQGAYHMKGKGLARLLDLLLPYLDGQHTLEEITQQAPTEHRALINRLIEVLATRGFIKDLALDRPHQLSPAEQATYAAEIAFIEAFQDSSAWRFERYRRSRVLLIGSGLTLQALVQATLQCGLADVHVLITSECSLEHQRLQDYLTLRHQHDPRQQLHVLEPLDWDDEQAVTQALTPFEAVLHLSDRPMMRRSVLLNRLCYQLGKLFLAATIIDTQAWLGPLVSPPQKGQELIHGCWECAWLRLQANLSAETVTAPYDFADYPEAVISYALAAPTAAVVANTLNFELFKYITEAGPLETRGHLLLIDLETLQSQRHSFNASAHCQCCCQAAPLTAQHFQDLLTERSAGPVLSQEEFSRKAAQLFDARLGLFSRLDEHNYTQIPLNIACVDLGRPGPHLPLVQTWRVFGAGTDFGAARRAATLRACEHYAAWCYDARRSLSGSAPELTGLARESLICYTRSLEPAASLDPEEDYLWAWELPSKRITLVPAAAIFRLSAEEKLPQSLPLGVAAGMSWPEALCRALFTHGLAELKQRLTESREPFPRVAVGALALSEAARRYEHLLTLQGFPISVYDLSVLLSDWGLPAFAFCCDGETWAYTCHLQAQAAIEEGLLLCLQHAQALHNGEPDYTLPPVAPLPMALRSTASIVPHYPPAESWEQMQQALLTALEAQGRRALIVPLDHDAALCAALPYIVRVVLGRSANDC